MKNIMIVVFLLLGVTFTYSQENETVIRKNVNQNAKELVHYLTKDGDSLTLESDFNIYTVEFQQSKFYRKYETSGKIVTLPINDLPYGKLTVLIGVNYKLIVFNLYRKIDESDKSPIKNRKKSDSIAIKTNDLKTSNPLTVGRNSLSEVKERTSFSFGDDGELEKEVEIIVAPKNKKKYYWVIISVKKNFGSSKLSKIANEKEMKALVRKNELDIRTTNGANNRLIVWEVYNVSSFMKAKYYNSNIEAISTKYVNPIPIYDSTTN